MKVAFLVPGIMATRLELNGEEVWPPKPKETIFGYDRIDKLQDDAVQPTELIYNVLSFQFYSTIKELLAGAGYTPGGAQKRYVDFPYDWRRDLFETVDVLADRLRALHDEGATEIALIGHSMGGLLSRLLLESGKFDNEPWFPKITLFAALAAPHLGAPLALARIFGVDSTMGIKGSDFAKLAANPKYPSGYQLIPAPGEESIWDLASDDLAALDPYDDATAQKIGMVPALVARARALHDVLGQNNQPAHVRYFYFAGVGHKTVTRVNVELGGAAQADHSRTVLTKTPDGGDGTVPIYSALPRIGQRQLVVNEHSTVFEGVPFKRVFFRLFGADAGAPVEVAGGEAPNMTVSLSTDQPVQQVGEPIEVTLSLVPPAGAAEPATASAIEGRFILDRVDEEGRVAERGVRETAIAYDGPGVTRLTVYLPPIEQAGLYLMRFASGAQAQNDIRFAVTEA
ncbi:lipase/acyltransferase domain-containing protein [Rhodovulum marinum]|uniref:Lecithin:cholesterol acyltransferase n=1 Tax=Rhodovulum marinum TaxID=320662 RepID=A0A4R2Q3L1_9RHOB|nr:alpha/beta fold hydrolase [Rhodovulum marinum]TCP43160.1 lecithin:cholesterol acyltransferase [Rhodovulum marinum]